MKVWKVTSEWSTEYVVASDAQSAIKKYEAYVKRNVDDLTYLRARSIIKATEIELLFSNVIK